MKKRTLILFSLLSVGLYASPVNAASFDCNKASTYVERTICNNPQLSKLDDNLAVYFAAVMADAKDNAYDATEQKRDEQLHWLIFQRNTCKDEACLIREYQERLGGQYKFGSTVEYTKGMDVADTIYPHTFGNFWDSDVIAGYDSKEALLDDSFEEINGMFILGVNDKPYLAVIDGDKWFNSSYACMINNELAQWSQNHWVLNDTVNGEADGEKTELRIYPATYQGKPHILMKDINGKYSDGRCDNYGGGGGYPIEAHFDGLVLERLQ